MRWPSGVGLHSGAFGQLVNLRHFRPLACVANSAQAADHVFQVAATDLPAKGKVRLDAYLASKLPQASRARLQASIKEGLVSVNGKPQAKASYAVKPGDRVGCSVLPPPPLEASPEDLPLDIVYEDEHLLVINKAADMVMHPSPGHYSGTLVNALLHHCGLPAVRLTAAAAAAPLSLQGALPPAGGAGPLGADGGLLFEAGGAEGSLEDGPERGSEEEGDSDGEELVEESDEDSAGLLLAPGPNATIRPGIVHRLDRGTTGLLVVAKDDPTHVSLAAQFKDRTVQRQYWALTLGVPSPSEGRVAANVGRDLRDRKKMAAFAYASARGRTAASNYSVLRPLAAGGAALVQWRLETGRTHQIRVHSKHIGHALLGDEAYGGGAAAAVAALAAARGGAAASQRAQRAAAAQRLVAELGRPALHAKTLGFLHPATGQRLQFDSALPPDFQGALEALSGPPFEGVGAGT